MEDKQPSCPIDCPNRRTEGITLAFGKKAIHLDPFEILMWVLIAVLPVGISIKDAWSGKLEFKESAERIVMISMLGAIVRMSPTEQISNFLSNFYIGKKDV